MSHVAEPPPAGDPDDDTAGKRKGRVKKRHTIARAVLATAVVLALATALSVVFLYRHYNGNLHVQDVKGALGNDRPPATKVTGPKGPVNILIMGSDDRDAPGDNIDNLTGAGKRSDTTILLHLAADRKHAYGVSIPRDSIVDRPSCLDDNGKQISGPAAQTMWNEAFNVGGPGCTIRQTEQLTGIHIDHYVVVDFAGFRDMVDAIGGVETCIPETIDDRSHGIYIPAGTRKLVGQQALNYVRERYVVGNGSDIGRMKRQQSFIASMVHQVVSANTLANPLHLTRFLDAATKSLTLDPELGNLVKIAQLGVQFRGIGLDKIQFLTIPSIPAPSNPNRLIWAPTAKDVWREIRMDQPISKKFLGGVIKASHVTGGKSHNPSSSPSSDAAKQTAQENGLCA
ncbi:MAG: LCP family protein [Nocardioides sp.]